MSQTKRQAYSMLALIMLLVGAVMVMLLGLGTPAKIEDPLMEILFVLGGFTLPFLAGTLLMHALESKPIGP